MQATPMSSPMTDRELAEIEFFASVGVFSEDYVSRLVAEVRRLQEEVASVSGIDMLVPPESEISSETGHVAARGKAVADPRRGETKSDKNN